MRYIEKMPEPVRFTEWKNAANDDWVPSFDNMASDVKEKLKASLIKEQRGICCYCESKLIKNDSHIEHFRPQERFQELSLDYNNLFCSCQSNLKKGDPRHCGNAKGEWFDEELLISPLSPDCASHFCYTADGHVFPANSTDAAAKETIKRLALDCPKLVDSRKAVLEHFLDDSISDEEALLFINKTIESASAENPQSFISAILSVFGKTP